MAHDSETPPTARQEIDLDSLRAYLLTHLEGFTGPLRIERFGGGQSNPTYQLVTRDKSYVLRTKPGPSAALLRSAHAIEREFAVMRALHPTGFPVPRMHLLCEDEAVLGRAFYVMEFVTGRVLWDHLLIGMSVEERSATYDEMNRVLAALHRINPRTAGLVHYGRSGNYFERQIGRWIKQYFASLTEPIAQMNHLADWLPAHIPAGAAAGIEEVVVHGDFRIDNLVFHPKEPRVLAVLDWELSTLGHPLADLSYHCLSWHIPVALERGFADIDYLSLGIPGERDYVSRYCQRSGRGDFDQIMADWNFYIAYNLFRLAAILQGIAKRVVEGTAAGKEARQVGAGARALAELGWRVAQRID